MASPSASERRSFTYARWVLYGSTRGGAGGLASSWPAGTPHRGHSHCSGMAASVAKLGRVSCAFEHQNDTHTRGAASPRSASPIGPAPTLLPRIALPLLTDHPLSRDSSNHVECHLPPDTPDPAEDTRGTQWLRSQPRTTMTMNHSTPKKMVIRSRFRSTTDDEPSVEDTPPPNRSDKPPPLPLCRRTSKIITRLTRIRMIESAISTAVYLLAKMTVTTCCQRLCVSAAAAHWRGVSSRYRQIEANWAASRLAPPTRAPSTSCCPIIGAMLSSFTDPPYRIRTPAAVSGPWVAETHSLIAADISCASPGEATSPVPMAQIGS